jgi:DNA-binding transcriptional ArsR family regulator
MQPVFSPGGTSTRLAPYFSAASRLDKPPCRLYLTNKLINSEVKHAMSQDHLTSTFAALADPTRRAILARLASGEATVTELAEPFAMSLHAISKHLKVLERAGLISRGRDAQWRPCRLDPEPLKEVSNWLEHYRQFWEERFERLDDYLFEAQRKDENDGLKG